MAELTFLQRVAVAIASGVHAGDAAFAWRELVTRGEAELWLGRARRVLEAMPVPTEAMIEAHFEAHARAATVFAEVPDIWRAMIEAALEHDQPPARERGRGVHIGGVLR